MEASARGLGTKPGAFVLKLQLFAGAHDASKAHPSVMTHTVKHILFVT